MASQAEVIASIKALELVFRDEQLSLEAVRLYVMALADIPGPTLAGAVQKIIRDKPRYFPTPGEIREAIAGAPEGRVAELEYGPPVAPPVRPERGVRVETLKEEIAAAYRMRFAQGRPFGPGLAADDPDVLAAVEERRAWKRAQNEALAAVAHDKDAHLQLAMQLIRQNLAGVFTTASGKPADPLAAIRKAMGVEAREEQPGFFSSTKEGTDDQG